MRRLGLIGAGGMAATVLEALAAHLPAPLEHVTILVRPGSEARAEALLAAHRVAEASTVRSDIAGFLADAPDVVAECAGHGAVRAHGEAVLRSGRDLVVIAIGALADAELHGRLEAAARAGGAKLVLPPGAVGGIDALGAARLSGLEEVTYLGRKPPRAWKGTQAETLLDLDALTEPTVFYEGTAREAARNYPQNANVAATVALAARGGNGGFDTVRVKLIADPGIARNVHEVAVRSGCADFTIRLEGRPSPANPKTSLTAGYSVARELLNRASATVI
ncbi:aspartate dehydrogenase [Roseomonas gilardii subsp. gilardii]|uniref:aspartate dehydrogenase n=1 Tax=Roseomonas gilardii TaxID=257708 RepID=UPI001FFBF467|nr:aspartate dehydrogenase [Roseomonas gilardii]UPG73194.1 aspartate dehydrogenase [Roseomonas gilardii subsp. gilardii]